MNRSTDTGRTISRPLAIAALCALSALALTGCGGKKDVKREFAASRVTTIGVNSYLLAVDALVALDAG